MKGELFKMGDAVGLKDRRKLAEIAIKWNLSHEAVTTVIVGTSNPDHLKKNLEVLKDLKLNSEDYETIEKIKSSSLYKSYEQKKKREFFE